MEGGGTDAFYSYFNNYMAVQHSPVAVDKVRSKDNPDRSIKFELVRV